jgi:PPM family protein phosphatase
MRLSKSDYETRIAAWLRRSSNKSQSTVAIPELSITIGTTVGEVRRENQDRAVAARFIPSTGERGHPPFVLLILCDGIGGLLEGERCAELAVAVTIITLVGQPDTTPPPERLRFAVTAANKEVFAKYHARGGATLVAVLYCGDGRTFTATAGDSRIYRCRAAKMVMEQTSVDDTIAGELSRLRGTEIRQEQLGSTAGHLAQFVGIGDGFQPRINSVVDLSRDELLLLTSDGAHAIGVSLMTQISAAAPDQHALVSRLLHLSRWCGGHDNATIICSEAQSKLAKHDDFRLNTASLELWDAFGKCELVLDPEYLRLNTPWTQERILNPHRGEPEIVRRTTEGSEFPSAKRKGKRDVGAKRERHVEVQVAKEAIRETAADVTAERQSGDLDLFGSKASAPLSAVNMEESVAVNAIHSETTLNNNEGDSPQAAERLSSTATGAGNDSPSKGRQPAKAVAEIEFKPGVTPRHSDRTPRPDETAHRDERPTEGQQGSAAKEDL